MKMLNKEIKIQNYLKNLKKQIKISKIQKKINYNQKKKLNN